MKCNNCGKDIGVNTIYIFKCQYCNKNYCIDCRHPETHNCHINSIWHP